jgi:Na+/glutamate symporter
MDENNWGCLMGLPWASPWVLGLAALLTCLSGLVSLASGHGLAAPVGALAVAAPEDVHTATTKVMQFAALMTSAAGLVGMLKASYESWRAQRRADLDQAAKISDNAGRISELEKRDAAKDERITELERDAKVYRDHLIAKRHLIGELEDRVQRYEPDYRLPEWYGRIDPDHPSTDEGDPHPPRPELPPGLRAD